MEVVLTRVKYSLLNHSKLLLCYVMVHCKTGVENDSIKLRIIFGGKPVGSSACLAACLFACLCVSFRVRRAMTRFDLYSCS